MMNGDGMYRFERCSELHTRKCSLDTTLSPGLNSRTEEPISTISPATSVTVSLQVLNLIGFKFS
jgi:hypothetical protein